MSENILTINSKVMCPHGGQVLLFTSNNNVFIGNVPVVLESDIHVVTGCSFTIGIKPSPCVKVDWMGGTIKSESNKNRLLKSTSIGKCSSAEGLVQGVALVINSQSKVMGG